MADLTQETVHRVSPRLSGSESKRLALVVDDEELNVDMLSRRLLRSGFDVHTASSGPQAIELVNRNAYDVILLDHMMPKMSGCEVLSTLRETYSPELLPIIMVTAIAESDKIADALSAGANDYVTKPIDYRVALARIQTQIARKDAEAALRKSEERYALAAKASRDGLWDWNLELNQVYFSARWMEMMGLDPDGITDSPDLWFKSVFPSDLDQLQRCLEEHKTNAQETLACEYRVHTADGRLRWMSARAVISRDISGNPKRLSGSQSDVTEEKTRDPLTGLPNRLSINTTIENTFLRHRSRGEAEIPYALLFLDLDGFKAVNDSLGHLAGDDLLRCVGRKLEAALNNLQHTEAACVNTHLARMSGDEFAVLIVAPKAVDAAQQLAALVQQEMAKPIVLDEMPVHVAFSIGIASSSPEHESYEGLIYDADVAMYAAKANGRGSVVLFSPELRRKSLDRLELENDLRNALKRRELSLVYQPKVRLQDGSLYGVEALLRWNHPSRGLISPGIFIPLAEQTGCIIEIGRWVLRSACTQLLDLHRRWPLIPRLELSVNLSPREFKQQGLVEGVAKILAEVGFPPECLHLEITEGVLFEDLQRARMSLLGLKALGVGLDLDDFGSGYSSLKYLQELPFDTLKIDRYFLSSLETDLTGASKMLETIVAMAGHLDMKVVAEGIEKTPQSFLMREMGCDFGQGFLFSRPVRVPELEVLLEREYVQRSTTEGEADTGSISVASSTTDHQSQEIWT